MSNVRSFSMPARERPVAPAWGLRRRAIRRVAAQELRDALFSWPWYITAAVGLLLAVLLIYNSVNFVATSNLLIVSRPFYLPLQVVATLAMLYITAWSILAIARPRDQGALRVLFFAPIDPIGLLGGHLLAGVVVYGLMIALTAPLLLVLAALTNVPLPPLLLVGAAVSPVFAAVAVAIGLFVSAIAPSSRGAMFVFIAVVLLLVGIQVGYRVLLSVPPTSTYYDTLLFVRALLRMLGEVLGWVSPVALLGAGLDAALRASWGELLLRIAAALAGCGVWLWLAVWGLRRRGVLP
jgi:hypothetical protein